MHQEVNSPVCSSQGVEAPPCIHHRVETLWCIDHRGVETPRHNNTGEIIFKTNSGYKSEDKMVSFDEKNRRTKISSKYM
jgi:hypothetical protein